MGRGIPSTQLPTQRKGDVNEEQAVPSPQMEYHQKEESTTTTMMKTKDAVRKKRTE